jgi:hypothetical protein
MRILMEIFRIALFLYGGEEDDMLDLHGLRQIQFVMDQELAFKGKIMDLLNLMQ